MLKEPLGSEEKRQGSRNSGAMERPGVQQDEKAVQSAAVPKAKPEHRVYFLDGNSRRNFCVRALNPGLQCTQGIRTLRLWLI